jgi:HD-GYP domain-containing protein (c-di-GMP phosphodiesterase class II)
MVRMSDLARGSVPPEPRPRAPEPEPAESKRQPGATVAAPPPPQPPAATRLRITPPPGPPRPEAAREAAPADVSPPGSPDSPEQVLQDLQQFLERVRDLLKGNEPFPWGDLERLIERVVQSLAAGSELFWLAQSPVVPAGVEYPAFHPARVAVLSVRIAMTLGYDRRRLIELGMAAALIDVGLWQLAPGILRRLDSLSRDETAQYEAHPRSAAERLRRWTPPFEGLVETVLQHHEREHGQGFPQGMQGAAVRPEAKIVGLADTYMALIVPPSLRPGLRPHEAIREIIRGKQEAFPSATVKALLSEISFFPPGTVVRLNTGEIGSVIAVNRNHPLRPRVEIVEGRTGPLPTPKILDLSEAPFVYVVGPVGEAAR